jgi:hypothetical protein
MWFLALALAIVVGQALAAGAPQAAKQDLPAGSSGTLVANKAELFVGCEAVQPPYTITFGPDSVAVNERYVFKILSGGTQKARLAERMASGQVDLCTVAFFMQFLADSLSRAGWPVAKTISNLEAQLSALGFGPSDFTIKSCGIDFPSCQLLLHVTDPDRISPTESGTRNYALGLQSELNVDCLIILMPEGDYVMIKDPRQREDFHGYIQALVRRFPSGEVEQLRSNLLMDHKSMRSILSRLERLCSEDK